MQKDTIEYSSSYAPSIVLGLMSGTSTDGLDIAAVRFNQQNQQIVYNLLDTQFVPYTSVLEKKLMEAPLLSGRELRRLDIEFGRFLADEVLKFIDKKTWKASLIGSHGHTVFHVPKDGYTMQIGCGATLASLTGTPVVCDFRQGDVALDGQGAPLVPIGDQMLFASYDYCVNLGGFANISCNREGHRVAWDICALNVVLNALASEAGLKYDEGGQMAANGKKISDLLKQLDTLEYYSQPAPKSLGTEWVEYNIKPVLNRYSHEPLVDRIHTFTLHVAQKIGGELKGKSSKAYFSGGGCNNNYLLSLIKKYSEAEVIAAEPSLSDFKEALIFALLAYLRWYGRLSTIPTVTGASRAIPAGAVYLP
jgi:anhydro-N-acetylmuramic acid kinase